MITYIQKYLKCSFWLPEGRLVWSIQYRKIDVLKLNSNKVGINGINWNINGIKLKYNGHYIGFLIALIFPKACDIPL